MHACVKASESYNYNSINTTAFCISPKLLSIWQSALTKKYQGTIGGGFFFFFGGGCVIFYNAVSYDALEEGAKNVSGEVCVGACLQKAVAGVEAEPAIHLSLALRPCDALHALFRL